jgi:hypothetical protein
VLILAYLHSVAVGLYIYIYTHTHIHTYTHTHIYIYIHTHTYTHTHTHTHIYIYIYLGNNSCTSSSYSGPGVEHPRGLKIYTFLLLRDILVTAIGMTYTYFNGVMNGIKILISSLLKCISTILLINLKFIFL